MIASRLDLVDEAGLQLTEAQEQRLALLELLRWLHQLQIYMERLERRIGRRKPIMFHVGPARFISARVDQWIEDIRTEDILNVH